MEQTVIVWVRMPPAGPALGRPLELRLQQRPPPCAAAAARSKQRVARPKVHQGLFTSPTDLCGNEPDTFLRERLPMQRLYAQALAFGVVPKACNQVDKVERRELQSLKKAVDKYQHEIEKLKKKLKRSKRMRRGRVDDETQAEKTDAGQAKRKGFKTASRDALPKGERQAEAAPKIPAHTDRKRPRAKATAMKQHLQAKKLASANVWQKELAARAMEPASQDAEKPIQSKSVCQKKKKLANANVWEKELAAQVVESALQDVGERKDDAPLKIPTHEKPIETTSVVAAHQALSSEQKTRLQKQIDALDDDRFDQVLAFLEPELGKPGDDEVRLDLDILSPERLRALVGMVTEGSHESPRSKELEQFLTGRC